MTKKIVLFMGILLTLIINSMVYVYAATKTISNVNIRIKSNINVGDYTDSLNISYSSDNEGSINVYTTSDRFDIVDAEITSGRAHVNIGDEIKIKITLEAKKEYSFKGTYSSSNVSVSGGKYVSSSKNYGDLVVNVKLNPIKGTFEAPESVEWKDNEVGLATWEEPAQTSGYYEIVLQRGGSQVKKVSSFKGTKYDFKQDMTQKGIYKFKIRTVGHESNEKDYGKNSDWVTSDEFYLDASSAPGKTPSNQQGYTVGWSKIDNTWYYRFPDGSLKMNGWEYIGDKWYLFDNEGKMLTGWQKADGEIYLLLPSGQMTTGWQLSNGKWYYLNTLSPQGKMLNNTWLHTSDGKYYYLGGDGAMCERWTQIGENWYYFYPGTGYMASDTVIDTFKIGKNGAWIR